MLPDLTNHLLSDWHHFFPRYHRPRDIQYVGISGSVEGGTVTFVAFGDKSDTPLFAVKIHRDPLSGERVLNEQSVLDYLQSKETGLSASVPQVILCRQLGNTWVVVQSILEGQPMADDGLIERTTTNLKVVRNLKLASMWLAQLYLGTRTNDPALTSSLLVTSRTTLDAFTDTFELSLQEQDVVHAIHDGLGGIINNGVAVQHRDFIRENILLSSSEKMSVIDWTDSRQAGFPLHDLFFFLTNYFARLGSGKGMERLQSAFLNTFYTTNSYSTIVKTTIYDHCQAIGLNLSQLDLLFGSFLVEHAMYEYNKGQRHRQRGSVPKAAVHLAAETNSSYLDATKQQVWIHLFRMFVQHYQADVSLLTNVARV